MKYVILIHANPEPWGHPTSIYSAEGRTLPQEEHDRMDREFEALLTEISASGEFVTAEALADPASSTLYGWSAGGPAGHRGPVRRGEGAARRLLPHRLRDPHAGRGDRRAVRPARWCRRAPAGDVARRRRSVTVGLEHVWRRCAPDVLAALVRRYGDFDAAEDAVQEALLAASRQWPTEGLPDNPKGWLITVASRRLVDHWRSERSRSRSRGTGRARRPGPGSAGAGRGRRRPGRARRLIDVAAAVLSPGAQPAPCRWR